MLSKEVRLLSAHYRKNPMDFLHREFVMRGKRLLEMDDLQQMEFYHRSTRAERVVMEGIKSCTGPGKTTVEVLVNLWFMSTQWDEELNEYPQGLAVSDSQKRLLRCYIKELRHWHQISPLCQELFVVTDTCMQSRNKRLKGLWRTDFVVQPKMADESAIKTLFSGFHTERIFIAFDESGEMNAGLHDGLTQVMSTKNLKYLIVLQAGNPRRVSSMLYHCEKREDMWNITEITGDPDDPRCSTRVDKEFNRRLIRQKGRNSDHVRTTVLAKYPNLGTDALFNTSLVEAAAKREIESQLDAPVILGIDVGGGGMDPTMAAVRKGRQVLIIKEINGNLHEQVKQVAHAHAEYGVQIMNIDATGGYGSDLRLLLSELGLQSIPVKFNEAGSDPEQFLNVRAEMVWNTARWMDDEVSIPDDPELVDELLVHTKLLSETHNRLQIVYKKIIKKILKRSPNKADALFLTHLFRTDPVNINHCLSEQDAEIKRVFGSKSDPHKLIYGKNISQLLN